MQNGLQQGVWMITMPGMEELRARADYLQRNGLQRPEAATPNRPLPSWAEPYQAKDGSMDEFNVMHTVPRVYRAGKVAVVELHGPIYRTRTIYTDFMAWIWGGVMLDEFLSILSRVHRSQDVEAIVLDVDSPGGMAGGIPEAAEAIRKMNKSKPVLAYAEDMMASAAYYLAAGTGKIVAHSGAAIIGSIGVVLNMLDDSEALAADGIKEYEFVSNVSPNKRPDPGSVEGAALYQALVDSTAETFVGDVARFRGVSTAKVKREFGQGWVMPAKAALEVGMIDRVASIESTIQSIAGEPRARRVAQAVAVEATNVVNGSRAVLAVPTPSD